jgi:hypothetical protein
MIMLKKLSILAAFTAMFFSTTSLAFAINDVHVVNDTNFDLLTSDTAAAVTIVAATGGQVTLFDVQSNYIDITLDNLSTVTFNVAAASRYFNVTKVSGSNDYTVTPTCPTTNATLAGTGAQVVLRLQVRTTDTCVTPPTPPTPTPTPSGGGTSGGYNGGFIWSPWSETTPDTTPKPPVLACSRTTSTPVPFTDTISHWAEAPIDTLYRRCIVDGKTETLFAPNDFATRAELVKIVLNTYNLGAVPYENLFLDVFEKDWFAGYVTNSAKRGIVIGYVNADGTSYFKPNQSITRAEALKVILKTKGITDFSGFTADFADVKAGDWYYDYVAYAQAKGILVGYTDTVLNADGKPESVTSFRPNTEITRAEISKIDIMVEAL